MTSLQHGSVRLEDVLPPVSGPDRSTTGHARRAHPFPSARPSAPIDACANAARRSPTPTSAPFRSASVEALSPGGRPNRARRSDRPARPRTARSRTRLLAAATLASVVSAASAAGIELVTEGGERTPFGSLVGGGRWTLVMLWTTDCLPCERQKPMIEAFHRDHAERDARVVSVALDGLARPDDVRRINAQHGTSYPVLLADESRFRSDYRTLVGTPLRATPTYLLYDRDGAFVAAHAGPVARAVLDDAVGPRR